MEIIIPIMRAITRVIITQFTNVFIAKYCIVHSATSHQCEESE